MYAQWKQGWGSKGQKLDYNRDFQVRRYRDKGAGRGVTCQGWTSSTKPMENGTKWHDETKRG